MRIAHQIFRFIFSRKVDLIKRFVVLCVILILVRGAHPTRKLLESGDFFEINQVSETASEEQIKEKNGEEE